MMATVHSIMTAEQLLAAPELGRCELVRGGLILMSPAGSEHGWIGMRLAGPLTAYVEERQLGAVFLAETGFLIARDPDTVRAPDVAFVRAERVGGTLPKGFFPGPPDLAVEVLSPEDRASEVLAKVGDWLEAGCRLVWVVDPRTRTATVYRGLSEVRVLRNEETLSGEDVVPGFSVAVSRVFGG